MKSTVWVLGVALAVAGAAAAIDVPLRDGTVVAAGAYKITGSFVMIEMADGSQVAFDVADVDLEALRAAEAAAVAEAGGQAAPEDQQPGETISGGRSLKNAGADEDQPGGLAITDRDVKHMRGSGVRGEDEQQEADASGAGAPEGDFQVGGSVVLNNVKVNPTGEGQWQIQGEVVNRNPKPVLNVTVKLETLGGGEPWSGEVLVAGVLGPDEKAGFEHGFMAEVPEGKAVPSVRASVMWMQEESKREPDYTKVGGVPHPSNLPQQIGGVTGADLRPTPIQ